MRTFKSTNDKPFVPPGAIWDEVNEPLNYSERADLEKSVESSLARRVHRKSIIRKTYLLPREKTYLLTRG
jgi:hypothetical protein